MDESKWVLLAVACAECGDWPLVLPKGIYDTAAEAAAVADEGSWKAHPLGGYISQTGSGAYWIAPVSALATVADDDVWVSEYESPRETVDLSA